MTLLPVDFVPVIVVFGLYGIYGHTELISWLVALRGGCDPHLSPGMVNALNWSPPMMTDCDELALFYKTTAAGVPRRLVWDSTMLLSVNDEDLDRTGWSWTRTKRQATPHAEAAASTTVLSLTHCGDTRLAGSWLALSHVYKRRNKLHPSDECCYYPHGAGLGLTFSLACYGYDWAGLVEPNVVCCIPHSEGCNQYFIWSFKPTSWQHQTTIIGGFMLVREAMAFYWLHTDMFPF